MDAVDALFRRRLPLAALAAWALVGSLPARGLAAGSGPVRTESRSVASFNAISVAGPIELDFLIFATGFAIDAAQRSRVDDRTRNDASGLRL